MSNYFPVPIVSKNCSFSMFSKVSTVSTRRQNSSTGDSSLSQMSGLKTPFNIDDLLLILLHTLRRNPQRGLCNNSPVQNMRGTTLCFRLCHWSLMLPHLSSWRISPQLWPFHLSWTWGQSSQRLWALLILFQGSCSFLLQDPPRKV